MRACRSGMRLIVSLTGVRSGNCLSLFPPSSASLRLPGPQHKVAVNDNTKRPAGTHAQGRLDPETARDELIARARAALLGGFADRADEIAFAAAETELAADPEQRREHDPLQKLPAMPVDPVGETGIALRIGRGHIVDRSEARRVGKECVRTCRSRVSPE